VNAEVRFVLDASAVLVYRQREPGYEKVSEALARGAGVSTVNLADVYAKLVDRDLPWGEIAGRLEALGLSVVSFTSEDARESAVLYPKRVAWACPLAIEPASRSAQGWGCPYLARTQRGRASPTSSWRWLDERPINPQLGLAGTVSGLLTAHGRVLTANR
jgi:PIN domain nuclease of toxin-antitoxin system